MFRRDNRLEPTGHNVIKYYNNLNFTGGGGDVRAHPRERTASPAVPVCRQCETRAMAARLRVRVKYGVGRSARTSSLNAIRGGPGGGKTASRRRSAPKLGCGRFVHRLHIEKAFGLRHTYTCT